MKWVLTQGEEDEAADQFAPKMGTAFSREDRSRMLRSVNSLIMVWRQKDCSGSSTLRPGRWGTLCWPRAGWRGRWRRTRSTAPGQYRWECEMSIVNIFDIQAQHSAGKVFFFFFKKPLVAYSLTYGSWTRKKYFGNFPISTFLFFSFLRKNCLEPPCVWQYILNHP